MAAGKTFRRYCRYHYLRLLRLRDRPEPLARGIAFGFASGFGPFIGFGVFAAWAFAHFCGGNRVAAVITALLFKWAIPIFIAANLATGSFFLGQTLSSIPVSSSGWWFSADFWRDVGLTFLTGSLINTILIFAIVYFGVRHWVGRRSRIGRRQVKSDKH
ncbi:MAG: DUF2062 domain-containing protein [Heliobacteriaceae bacterium]|nr:DUF2062 domain-containing protein [Heliobacteriaceae bacterium]MDD4587942.1 DUF2062 domain-containing protein [Heliobacteriaceae bacterium]